MNTGGILRPEIPVQCPVLDRLADVIGCDSLGAFEVGDRTGDLQDAIVGARTEIEFAHRKFKQPGSRGVERA